MSKKVNSLLFLLPKKWRLKLVYGVVIIGLVVSQLLIAVTTIVKKKKFNYRLIAVMIILMITPIILLWSNSSKEEISEVITYSTDKPDEVKPDDSYKWIGSEEDPRKIIMPSLKTEGFIQKVGVDQNKEIAVPSNIHLAGWFVNSSLPGNKGLTIIDGHVDGREATGGIFKNIDKLNVDDELFIELGSGKLLKYQTMSVVSLPTTESASKLFSQDPQTSHQINLITCSGNYDQNSRQYDERVIVSARLIES